MEPRAQRTAAVAALMAVWWITEAASIPVTAAAAACAFPFAGHHAPAARWPSHYANHIIFLFVGGFIIAIAMERWNLHRRVALATISFFGTQPDRLVLGFMCATALPVDVDLQHRHDHDDVADRHGGRYSACGIR